MPAAGAAALVEKVQLVLSEYPGEWGDTVGEDFGVDLNVIGFAVGEEIVVWIDGGGVAGDDDGVGVKYCPFDGVGLIVDGGGEVEGVDEFVVGGVEDFDLAGGAEGGRAVEGEVKLSVCADVFCGVVRKAAGEGEGGLLAEGG